MATSKRDRLIGAAINLFRQYGYHATGIERILTEAGVAKMTLYNHFRSKDELIVAALRKRDQEWQDTMQAAVDQAGDGPADRFIAAVKELTSKFEDETFRGCLFLKAIGEFPEPTSPIRQAVLAHYRTETNFWTARCSELGCEDAQQAARQIAIIMHGATTDAAATLNQNFGQAALRMTDIVLQSHGVSLNHRIDWPTIETPDGDHTFTSASQPGQ